MVTKCKNGGVSNTNKKFMIAFILGILISGTSVYAATKYKASDITYKDTNVENALNELYDNDILYINDYKVYISTTLGGDGHIDLNAEKYNNLTIDSRTIPEGPIGTTYWIINGYTDSLCTEDYTTLLKTTTPSSSIEKYDISQYKCLRIQIACTKVAGGTSAWYSYYFNGITLSR